MANDGETTGDRRRPPPDRDMFVEFAAIATRWGDNDCYGHVNNAVYLTYFDTVINRYLIEFGGIDPATSPIIAVAAETSARFVASFSYPDVLDAGLAVTTLSTRSVRYAVGLFAPREVQARVYGEFVHVFCDRATMRPAVMPDRMRAALERIRRPHE